MLSMLEWLCAQLMEAEVSTQLGAEKNEHNHAMFQHNSALLLRFCG